MTHEEKELRVRIRKVLMQLIKNGPALTQAGICENVLCECNISKGYSLFKTMSILSNCWVNWPKFSGSLHYPIISKDWRYSPQCEYLKFNYSNGLWTGEQGELRRELLQYLYDNIESPLEN